MAAGSPEGLVVVDKPQGLTSHDVVARVRRIAGTRRVGHAGTLDPMATGVLVLGLGRATRLLGHLSLADKTYRATIRLGEATVTDDAEGEVIATVSAAGVGDDALRAAVETLTGTIEQVPSKVSAVKVAGRRSYQRVRAGEDVELTPRTVTVTAFEVGEVRRPSPDLLDVDVVVTCSTGTYVRALARDLGQLLGVGGHLTALRRTRVGRFDVAAALPLERLADDLRILPLGEAVAACFPRRDVDAVAAAEVGHGRPLPSSGEAGPTGVFGPDGQVLALMAPEGSWLRPLVVFVG